MTARRLVTVALLGALAVALLSVTPAYAHTYATYCGHSSTGLLHRQYYVVSFQREGRHWHVVQLLHPWGLPQYDTRVC